MAVHFIVSLMNGHTSIKVIVVSGGLTAGFSFAWKYSIRNSMKSKSCLARMATIKTHLTVSGNFMGGHVA